MNNYLRNTIFWGLATTLAVTPFIVASNLFFPYISGKGFFLRAMIELVFALWLVLVALEPKYLPRWNMMTKAVAVFTSILILSTILSVNPFRSLWSNYERMEGLVLYLHLAAYFLMLISVCGMGSLDYVRKQWRIMLHVALGASVVMTLYGLLSLADKSLISSQSGLRIDGRFGNAAYMAVYMLLHIFLALYLLAQSKRESWQKWLYGSTASLEFIVLFYTQTRGAFYGAVIGLLFALIYIAYHKRGRWMQVAGITFAVAALLYGGLYVNRGSKFVSDSPALSRIMDVTLTGTVQARSTIWSLAVEGLKEKPILGYGLDNFNLIFNKFYRSSLYNQEQWFDRAHNVFLDWLTAAGLLGLLSYLALFAVGLYLVWKHEEKSVESKAIFTGLFIAYFIHNIFVFDNQVSSLIFFTLLAYLYSFEGEHSRGSRSLTSGPQKSDFKGPDTEFQKQKPETERMRALRYSFAGVAVIALVPIANLAVVKPFTAGQTLIDAITPCVKVAIQEGKQYCVEPPEEAANRQLASFKKVFELDTSGSVEAREQVVQAALRMGGNDKVSEPVRRGFLSLAQAEMEKQVRLTPDDARYRLFMGLFYQAVGNSEFAINELTKAVELTPKKQAMRSELGLAYLRAKKTKEAIKVLKESYELYPVNLETGKALVTAYMADKDKVNATKTLEQMISINPEFKAQGEFYINEIKAGRNP